jgi:hypothetical protein
MAVVSGQDWWDVSRDRKAKEATYHCVQKEKAGDWVGV